MKKISGIARDIFQSFWQGMKRGELLDWYLFVGHLTIIGFLPIRYLLGEEITIFVGAVVPGFLTGMLIVVTAIRLGHFQKAFVMSMIMSICFAGLFFIFGEALLGVAITNAFYYYLACVNATMALICGANEARMRF